MTPRVQKLIDELSQFARDEPELFDEMVREYKAERHQHLTTQSERDTMRPYGRGWDSLTQDERRAMATAKDQEKTAKDQERTATKEKNKRIWSLYCMTNPKATKPYKGPGGFAGTAVKPTYQFQRATELWGPCGVGWGVELVGESIVDGGPIGKFDENCIIYAKLHTLQIRLWYMDGAGTGIKRCEVYAFGSTQIVENRTSGYFTNCDYAKSSMTDAISKALQFLGFSADIYMDLFNDPKYVERAKELMAGDHVEPISQAISGNVPSQNEPGPDEHPHDQPPAGVNGDRQVQQPQNGQQGGGGPDWRRWQAGEIQGMDDRTLAQNIGYEMKSRLGMDAIVEGRAVAKHVYGSNKFDDMSRNEKENFLCLLNDATNKSSLLRDVPAALLAEMKRQAAAAAKR